MIFLFRVSLKITALVDVWKVQYQYILDCLGSRDCDFEQYRVEFTNHGPGIEVVVIRFCRHRAQITHKSETENDNLTKQLSAADNEIIVIWSPSLNMLIHIHCLLSLTPVGCWDSKPTRLFEFLQAQKCDFKTEYIF